MVVFSLVIFNQNSSSLKQRFSCQLFSVVQLIPFIVLGLLSQATAAVPVLLDGNYQLNTLASGAPFISAGSISASSNGDIFVAYAFGNGISGDQIFAVDLSGAVNTLVAPAATAYLSFGDIEQDVAGNVYSFDVVGNRLLKTD